MYEKPIIFCLVTFFSSFYTACIDEIPVDECTTYKNEGRCGDLVAKQFCRVTCGECVPGKLF